MAASKHDISAARMFFPRACAH
jgi:hypothetical protein